MGLGPPKSVFRHRRRPEPVEGFHGFPLFELWFILLSRLNKNLLLLSDPLAKFSSAGCSPPGCNRGLVRRRRKERRGGSSMVRFIAPCWIWSSFMKKLSQDRRFEYWKYQCAALSFDYAKEVADYLICGEKSSLIYQLITSLYILYGRPFKERKKFRVSEDIVPQRYLEEHGLLLDLRDKTFAHVDIDGLPEKNVGQLSKILLKVRDGVAQGAMASLLPQGYNFERIRDLCTILHDICNEKAREILIYSIDGTRLPDLTYEIDLTAGERYLMKSVEY